MVIESGRTRPWKSFGPLHRRQSDLTNNIDGRRYNVGAIRNVLGKRRHQYVRDRLQDEILANPPKSWKRLDFPDFNRPNYTANNPTADFTTLRSWFI